MNIEFNEKEMEIITSSLKSRICDRNESIRKVSKAPYQYIDSHRVSEWKEKVSIIESILDRFGNWMIVLLLL